MSRYQSPARRAVVYSPNGPISERMHSHRAAWARMRAHQLVVTKRYDEVKIINKPEDLHLDACFGKCDLLIYLGMEWSGSLNFFGGANAETYDRLSRPAMLYANGAFKKVYFLDENPTNLGAIFHERKDAVKFDPKRKNLADWTKLFLSAETLDQGEPKDFGGRVVLGDSHALGWYRRDGALMMRNDGQTLFGALELGLDNLFLQHFGIKGLDSKNIMGKRLLAETKDLTLVLGNIDVRHHLLRHHERPAKAAKDPMFDEFSFQVHKTLRGKLAKGAKITVVLPLPIEPETRRIPKTGWYKGTPFFGPREKRAELALRIRDRWLEDFGIGFVHEHPDYFFEDFRRYTMREDVMEKPQSVHVSWEHSRFEREGRIV